MNPVRERRLRADHLAVETLCRGSNGRVLLEAAHGDPADTYLFLFRCRSVTALEAHGATFGQAHRIRVYLPAAYPAAAPVATALTPVAHPHVWPNRTVCLGAWSPSEKLDSVIQRIAALLIYEPSALNWRSVADERMVPWARAHMAEFPLGAALFGGEAPRKELAVDFVSQ
jgi:hypothetical protein